MKTFLRWLAIAIAVWVAVWLVPGIYIEGSTAWLAVAILAAILAFVNTFFKPVLKTVSSCLIVLTFGLFCLVINAGLLYFSAWVCRTVFDVGFYVTGFWPAFWGGVVISIISVIFEALFGVKES